MAILAMAQAAAGPVQHAFASLDGTGVAPTIVLTQSGDTFIELNGFRSEPDPGPVLTTFRAHAASEYGVLKVLSEIDDPYRESSVTFNNSQISRSGWLDSLSIVGAGDLLPGYVTMVYEVTGQLAAVILDDADYLSVAAASGVFSVHAGPLAEVSYTTRDGWHVSGFESSSILPGDTSGYFNFQGFFSFDVPINSNGQSDSFLLSAIATAGAGGGYALADFSHTMRPVSVLLADGRTVEEAGYTLTFDSGMASPNLDIPTVVTPEPGSLALMGLGGLGLVTQAIRRRSKKRST